MLIRLFGAIQRYFGALARLQEVLLPCIVKAMVHKREKLTAKEEHVLDFFAHSSIEMLTKRLTKKRVMIALVGLVGSGKSSVAHELAPEIGAAVIEGDAIRVFLRKEGERYDKARRIAEDAGLYLLGRGANVIFDSDHIDPAKRASLKAKAKEVGAELIFIRTFTDSNDNPQIPGYNLDEMIGRNMIAPPDKFFSKASTSWEGTAQQKGSVVKLREMIRRILHHYRWVNETGGRFILRKLPFKIFAEINTINPKWEKEVKKMAEKIIEKF
ncbi:MAG: AAA family ATPase [Candidatus Paceibacterota bacterium]